MTTRQRTLQERRTIALLASVAHELRNRLHTIMLALQHMEASAICDGSVPHTKALIEGQVNQLIRLVDDLSDMDLWRTGKLGLRKENVDLAAIVALAADTCRSAIVAGEHALSLRLPRQPLNLQADPLRLVQVVVNLIDNSAKYSDPGSRIVVSVERGPSDAVICVQDEGIGLSPELLPRVFDLFVRGDQRAARPSRGLGIGLSLVKRIVELHGGTVSAHSRGRGLGSVFTVLLPAGRVQRRNPACHARK